MLNIKKNINKPLEHYFRDWESTVFGFGYGSGEKYILSALKYFLEICDGPAGYSYDFSTLQKRLMPTVLWLLINILCKADIIDYDSSPRFGWLSAQGIRLKEFIGKHSVEELCKILDDDLSEYIPCLPTACNCGLVKCSNPFWNERGA